jgi:hypothetical protein
MKPLHVIAGRSFKAHPQPLEPQSGQTGAALAFSRLWELLDTVMHVGSAILYSCSICILYMHMQLL